MLQVWTGRGAVVTTHHVAEKSPTPSAGFIRTYERTQTLPRNSSFGHNAEANIIDTVWHGTNWADNWLSILPGDKLVWNLKIRELPLVMKVLSKLSICWGLFIRDKTRWYLKATKSWWAKLQDGFTPLFWLHNTYTVIFSHCRWDLISHKGSCNQVQTLNTKDFWIFLPRLCKVFSPWIHMHC